jgi:hypothetical protein
VIARSSSWSATSFRGLAKLGKVSLDALASGDHREQLHAAVAVRAFKHVDVEGPLQKLSPGAISAGRFRQEL